MFLEGSMNTQTGYQFVLAFLFKLTIQTEAKRTIRLIKEAFVDISEDKDHDPIVRTHLSVQLLPSQ